MNPTRVVPGPARKRKQRPDPDDPVIQAMLGPLADALANPDEAARDAAVGHVVLTHTPGRSGPLTRALVELLGRDEGPVRRRAMAYLTRLGGLARPSLVLRFTRTDSPALQRGIIEALTQIAESLDRAQQVELMKDLVVLLCFAVDASIRQGLGQVLIAIRRASEAAARTGCSSPPDSNQP
jgi:hypothetical protein